MLFWNTWPMRPAARNSSRTPPNPAAWNRGAYLMEGARPLRRMPHAAQLHAGRLKGAKAFAGAEEEGWLAYNLQRQGLPAWLDWSDAQLAQYLSTGQARMAAARPPARWRRRSRYSLRYPERRTIFRPSSSICALVPAQVEWAAGGHRPTALRLATPTRWAKASLFNQACAGCHLPDGAGRQSPWAALAGAQSTGDPAGTNLIQVLAHGTQIETAQGTDVHAQLHRRLHR